MAFHAGHHLTEVLTGHRPCSKLTVVSRALGRDPGGAIWRRVETPSGPLGDCTFPPETSLLDGGTALCLPDTSLSGSANIS